MAGKIFLGLLICNLLWSAHPLMAKLALADLAPAHVAWLRYVSAFISFQIALFFLRARKAPQIPKWWMRVDRPTDWLLVSILGITTFCFSPLMQMTGLAASRATDNALIIAMEPMITVLMAYMILGESINLRQFGYFASAIAGFLLLSGFRLNQFSSGLDGHFWGNVIMLVSCVGEAVYSSLGRKLMPPHSPVAVFGTGLTIGVGALTIATLGIAGLPDLGALSLTGWLGILWLGPVGTMAAYLFWMMVLPKVSVASLAVTLFIQPIFGTLWGVLFLGEWLSLQQSLGAALILVGVLFQFTSTTTIRATAS